MKQNMADVNVSMQVTDEKACAGEGKMNLDPEDVHTELGALSIGAISMAIQVVPCSLGASSSGPVKAVPVHDAPEEPVTVNASALSLEGSETYSPLSSASYGATKQQETLLSVSKGASDINGVEQSLLHELEDMGFNQRTLNTELPRKIITTYRKLWMICCAVQLSRIQFLKSYKKW
eukprot:Gb_08611 [translate_table: standard]